MDLLIIGIFVTMIIVGIAINIFQKNKYFYIGYFVYNNDTESMVINFATTGCYTINITKVSSNPNKRATFEIEEGKYEKAIHGIFLYPTKHIVYIYSSTKSLISNRWSNHKSIALKNCIISIKNKELSIGNNKLSKLSGGKVISNKRFLK